MTTAAPEHTALLKRGAEFTSAFTERALSAPSASGMHFIGSDRVQVIGVLAALEGQTRRRVDIMLEAWHFVPYRDTRFLDDRSAARGLSSSTITTQRHLTRAPLLLNDLPDCWIGPAPASLMIVDDERLVLWGPMALDGTPMTWVVTDPWFVRQAVDLRDDALHGATCVAEVREPLTPRRFEIAQALCVGETDTSLARRLGISTRSVEREVAAVLEYVGARSRLDAVARIMGRELRPPYVRGSAPPHEGRTR